MLFRQRVSLPGALHLHRRACEEMAAHSYARLESQSLQKVPLGFTAPQAEPNLARPLAFPPSHHSLPIKDCRWKRGRPVSFSSRAFSTKQTDLHAQGCVVREGSAATGTARRTSKQQDTGLEGCPSQLNHLTAMPTHYALHSTSSKSSEARTISTSTAGTHNAGRNEQSNTNSGPDIQPTTLACTATSDGTNINFSPTPTDEGDSQSGTDESTANDVAKGATEIHKPLTFQIPEDVLRAAMAAPENTKASFWSSNLYRGPGDKKILVHYCKTKEVAERVAQHFVNEKVVGFDVEWKPWASPSSIKKNVSLIQLACENRIALFHVALFSGRTATQLMPPTLKAILESPEMYKVGVAVKGDFSRIAKFLDIEPQGVFELSRLHNLVEYIATEPSKVSYKLVGLAAQVQRHLQLPLYKGGQLVDDPDATSNVRSSDWSLVLNHEQIHYAAADAYAGFRLYDVLEEKRKKLKPTPPRPSVCDHDTKPRPKPSDNKPRKKRATVTKTDEASTVTGDAAPVLAKQGNQEKKLEEFSQSQETEGYETAQEDLLDSHQLEGEDLAPSEQSYERTDESEDDTSVKSTPSHEHEEKAASAPPKQRRIGRVNLSWLKGPDPAYPTLPNVSDDEDASASSDEDLVDISLDQKGGKPHQNIQMAVDSGSDEKTDEFDDSELEEALQVLEVDSTGNLKDAGSYDATARPSADQSTSRDTQEEMSTSMGQEIEGVSKTDVAAQFDLPTQAPHRDKEEQRLSDLLNDPNVIEDLLTPTHTPFQPMSTDPPITPHTSEYTLATAWAQSYLTSTIPPPTSRAVSHIRATIPHLRAYHMWRHQGLSLGEIAHHLRDPPLAASTVGNYVLQAITLERMEYDREHVRGVLMGMPSTLRRGKWRGLAEKVGAR